MMNPKRASALQFVPYGTIIKVKKQNRKDGAYIFQTEKRLFLIRQLLEEKPRYRNMEIHAEEMAQKRLLRSLFNIRMPGDFSEAFLKV